MDKDRIEGASAGRAGTVPRSPSIKVRRADSATMHGKRLSLPQQINRIRIELTVLLEEPSRIFHAVCAY